MSPLHPAIVDLTWDDLHAWAGAEILARGKSYRNNVEDPRLADEGGLLGWVQGSDRYATHVRVEKGGALRSRCTCLYPGAPCKHAVALVLVALEREKRKETLKTASDSDKRWRLLERAGEEDLDDDEDEDWGADEEDDWDEDEDEDDEDEAEDDEEPPARRARRGAAGKPAGKKGKESNEDRTLREHFEAMSHEELLAFALERARMDRKLVRTIVERAALRGGKANRIIEKTRREIEEITSEEVWYDHWQGGGNLPDYSPVRRKFENLLATGEADAVLELAELLWEQGQQQVEEANDEGQTGEQIGACMEVVRRALPLSERSRRDQVLWGINILLHEDYSILGEEWKDYPEAVYTPADWAEVAAELKRRLAETTEETDAYEYHYNRRAVVNWLVKALERGGRKREIIPTLEREAPLTGNYEALIDRLIAAGRDDEARRWIAEGYQRFYATSPAQTWPLEERLRALEERAGNHPAVAALRALEFIERPDLDRYKKLAEATESAGVWPAARETALTYLETGTLPQWGGALTKPARAEAARGKTPCWPLPAPPLPWAPSKMYGQRTFPIYEVLIEVALFEARHDEAIALLARRPGRGAWDVYGLETLEDKVAKAVRESHPDFALGVWRRLAENQINQTSAGGYEAAGGHLRQMREVYERTGRVDEWAALVQDIRQRHKRKRNMMAVLDEVAMGGRRIVESR